MNKYMANQCRRIPWNWATENIAPRRLKKHLWGTVSRGYDSELKERGAGSSEFEMLIYLPVRKKDSGGENPGYGAGTQQARHYIQPVDQGEKESLQPEFLQELVRAQVVADRLWNSQCTFLFSLHSF
ncbi:hypothetical protein CHARACLAT_022060 [Characodon lateralis]|uniref:Uncharacterized protein n=1 Tax=Characodon lateralis TaxID=208331 RepID=A0ABU7EFY8_9TELE|nr:hypothetical protein [Characodon lateralis]